PKLNKIGGEQFDKIKQKVKESVSKLAIDLLDIYSKREKSKGFVYSPSNYLYEEFENAFPYEETEDQTSAINDIKKDMEGTKIMDRLICGDVGYGKTEVALRAIYKAVLDGKQVAFLCPTTILSQQHYQTAKERFSDFMVNVQVLNRFKTKAQQEQILKDLKEGKVDLIIGTHRLLSGDVTFKDLGLLVLDEEQRFGVADKEKIKDLKKNVDVLTLSATPIPRTLNMALTGIRDISIISTPPKERIAVKTFVQEESDTLILNACKKELLRGGQVIYVFNRVEGIYAEAERIKNLLPDARVGVAHGQMPEKLLEQTIMQLYNGEFDILVATTLIESGIDLPDANTLIVIDSDRLGLSELYQLRGRIGRSDKVAYAYFTFNPSKILTSDAYKRLDAILEYTELGSGFKIAMRDLEIRGAGDILGKEQHGHLEKVGYDLYCKLLEEAVKELKGEKVKELNPIKIDILTSASLPESYVKSEDERIKLYSKISQIATSEEYDNVKSIL
ncbi:MAG: DEAD/DEAH box helicase, partial [Clostridia bacterium]|nr:DEAD/DEAH box helicase [Clostridia bacterium]